jgi:hypothetical protein
MNAILNVKLVDLHDDTSTPDHQAIWEACGTTIYHVLNEEGVNVAGAQVRRISNVAWLYVDDVEGYQILDDDDVADLFVCLPEDDPKLG